MKNTRILALVLAVLMVAALFVGCSNTENPADTTAATTTAATTTAATTTEATTTEATTTEATTTEATTTEATTTEATTTEATTTEPATPDFGGYVFTFGTTENKYLYATDEAGNPASALDEEWADAYAELEDTYNFTFDFKTANERSMEDAMLMVLAGDYAYDAQDLRTAQLFPLATRGCMVNFASDEMLAAGVDVYDPELFYQPVTQWTNILGGVWGVRVASKYYLPEFGYVMLFNKQLCDEAGYPADTLYDMVRNHEWNFTVYKDLCSKLAKDLDGDGVNDIWGTGGGSNPYGSEIMLAGGNAISEIDGKLVYTLDSEKSMDGLQFMSDEFWSGWRFVTGGASETRELFAAGKVGMAWAAGSWCTNPVITGSEIDYGILPMPVADDREDYVDCLSTPRVLCMFNGNCDYDVNVQILKLWADVMTDTENWKDTYCEKFCRGQEVDLEMLCDYVLPKIQFGTYKLTTEMESLVESECIYAIQDDHITPAQAVEAVVAKAQDMLDKTFNQK